MSDGEDQPLSPTSSCSTRPPILPPLARSQPSGAPIKPGGRGSPSHEAMLKAQEAVAKFKLRQSRKDMQGEGDGDADSSSVRPQLQHSAYHKAAFDSSFASTIDAHHAEAERAMKERDPYDDSEMEYSEASELDMDMSSHHDLKITKQISRTLSQRRVPPRAPGALATEVNTPRSAPGTASEEADKTTYLDAAPSFISPLTMKTKKGEHFSSPNMAALAFHEGDTPHASPERFHMRSHTSANEEKLPDHVTHLAEYDSLDERVDGGSGGDVEAGDAGRGSMWASFGESPTGRKTRRSATGRDKATGFVAIVNNMAQDCAQYLRDIECEELVPDCRPKTWYRMVCTRNGRASVLRPIYTLSHAVVHYTRDPRSWQKGAPFIFLGLALSFVTEIFAGPHSSAPHYNSAVILTLLAAAGYSDFPERRMAPQIIIALLCGLSLAMDFVTIALSPSPPPPWIRFLTAVGMLAKTVALWAFLLTAQGTMRARRYLWRRLRLFIVPLNEPRRLMKEVRGRMMAILWIQGAVAIAYLGYFVASVTSYGYQVVMTSGRATVSLSVFLLFKSILSAALAVGLLLDTDPTLCLAYFGCLGFSMKYVKEYTRSKKEELGGWPYPFFFNSTRFTFFEIGKGADFMWGIVGWSTLSVSFGSVYGNLEGSLRFMITLIYITLFFGDIWVALLTYSVHWLMKRHDLLEEHEALSDSDDSELDDLGIRQSERTPLASKGKRRSKSRRRARGQSRTDDYSSGDSDADMYGVYDEEGGEGSGEGGRVGQTAVPSSRSVNSHGERLFRGQEADESNPGRWSRTRTPTKSRGGVDVDNDDDEVRSSDSEGTRKRKRAARRLAIKALLKNSSYDGGVLPGSEHEVRRAPKGRGSPARSALERFKDKVRLQNRGGTDRERLQAAGGGEGGDQFDDLRALQDEAEAMSGSESHSETSEEQARRELSNEGFTEAETGGAQFASSRKPHAPKTDDKAASDGGGQGQQVDDISVDYGTYSEPASPVRAAETEAGSVAGYYDPVVEGAFTWAEGEESVEHLQGKRADYFASHISSPEEAQAKHAALVQSMETSFEVDPEVKLPLSGRAEGPLRAGEEDDNSPFDLSVEMNPYEVKALAGGFRDDDDAEDASLSGYEEEEEDLDGESLVLSPLLKAQAKDAGESDTTARRAALADGKAASTTKEAAPQRRVRYKLDPGSIVTSPPRELLDAYLNNNLKGHAEKDKEADDGRYGAAADDKDGRAAKSDLDSRGLQNELDYLTGAGTGPDAEGMNGYRGDAKRAGVSDAKKERAQARETTAAKEEEEEEEDEDTPLALDRGASIEASVFASLYEVLEPACQFNCEISPVGEAFGASPGAAVSSIHPEAVTAHLQRVGFQVVATGPVLPPGDMSRDSGSTGPPDGTHGFKMFVFASGYKLKPREGVEGDALPIFGLCELVIKREKDEEADRWGMSLAVRCTQKRHATGFVAELSLGNLFELK